MDRTAHFNDKTAKAYACNFEIKAFSEQHGKEICRWHYEEEYAVYNLPCWKRAVALGYDISDPEIRAKEYYAVYLEKEFMGYCRLIQNEGWVLAGVGMRPDYCGRGYGHFFVQAVVDLAKTEYPGRTLRLMVRTFNKRAVCCYRKAGFITIGLVEKQVMGQDIQFLVMEYHK